MKNNFLGFLRKYTKISLLISGGLYALAFSPFYVIVFFPILLFYLNILEHTKNKKQAFWYGVLFYAATNAVWVVWILNVSKYIGPILILGYVLMGFILGLFGGVISLLTKKFGLEYFPIISTAIEYIRQFGWWKFPWMFTGYVMGFHPVAMQSVDIYGIHGLSIVVLYMLIGVYFFFKDRKRNKKWIIVSSIIFSFLLIYGLVRYNTNFKKDNKTVVTVLQGSIPQNLKWKSDYKDSTYYIYNNLIKKEMKKGTTVYFWPETAIPAWFNRSSYDKMRIKNIARNTKANHVFGALRLTGNKKENYGFYNSLYNVSPNGKIIDFYDKELLVPFGEYMPLSGILPIINQVDVGGSNFSFGKKIEIFNVANLRIGNSICYEILFPYYVRKQVRNGANILFTGSNDGWFEFIEPYQHFEMAMFRAVEERRYLVRSGNIGISGIINEKGDVIEKIGLKKRAAITGDVFSLSYKTIYYYIGDLIVFLSIALMVFFVLIRRKCR